MEFNQSVANPMLVGSIELLLEEDTPGHRQMFLTELMKAKLLSPAIIKPQPQTDAEGKQIIAPDSSIQLVMLRTEKGGLYFMGFTDDKEYQKWAERNQPLPGVALKFDDYVSVMMKKDAEGNDCPALGFVINPFGVNMVVPKDTMAKMMAARMIHVAPKKGAGAAKNPPPADLPKQDRS